MSDRIRSLVDTMTDALRALSQAAAEAYWQLATTGKAEAAQHSADREKEMRLYLADRERFALLKAAMASPSGDPLLDRQVTELYYSSLENQLKPDQIAALVGGANELEQLFSNFRGTVDGEPWSDNQIRDTLGRTTDNELRRKAWEASKQIGLAVATKLVSLVKLRNAAAQSIGFGNFYEMQLRLSEVDSDELAGLMAALKRLTDGPYAAMKAEVDQEQAERFGIRPVQMRPWHYPDPFFQEVPTGTTVDLDGYFAGKSLEMLATRFFDGIGMDVRDILSRSDLYARAGKNQHAFCTDIDREGDVRVLCNLQPNSWWMATLLHELGHGVYDKYIGEDLPWLLRRYAHINSTEAIAMYFGRLTRNAEWLSEIAGVPEPVANAAAESLQREQSRAMLIFVRWVLVMYHFESALYANPDQDLNGLWWALVHEMQGMAPPDQSNGAEWATKIHLGSSPVYYHNYLIGEVTASHLLHYMVQDSGTEQIVDNESVGTWLRLKFFQPGARFPWNELIRRTTGEPLNPRYFVDEFVRAMPSSY